MLFFLLLSLFSSYFVCLVVCSILTYLCILDCEIKSSWKEHLTRFACCWGHCFLIANFGCCEAASLLQENKVMNSMDHFDKSPLLEGNNSSQENTAEYTGDGSVCVSGHPASRKHTGSWKASSLTIVCSFCCYLAYSSIGKNLVSYLTKILQETNLAAARDVATWQGTSYLAPLIGAFIADSYLGKYRTALISCTILIIGMMILLLSAALPLISIGPQAWSVWADPISSQYIIFFVGLYMVGLGYGAQSPCVTSFGADQFDDTDEVEKIKKSSFFNWHYFAINTGSLIAGTVIVWVQEHEGWLWGFTISTLFVTIGIGIFFLGSIVYRFQKPGGSPLARICQVVVAATRNFDKVLPCDSSALYEFLGQGSAIEGSRKLEHTTGLEFFDKAAIVTLSDCESPGPSNTWKICTVTQVEELKILIRMFPIWSAMVLFAAVQEHMFSTFVEQGMVMDKHIGSFEIPAASFQSIDTITVIMLVPVYERVLVPVLRKFTGRPNGITSLQRIGIGLFFSMSSMVSAALVENNRLQIAQAEGLVHLKEAVPMSIMWQGPQYFLLGVAEVFSNIGLTEFFYDESPDAMRSLCMAFSLANISAGNYLSSFILSLVPVFTAKGGSPGWIPDNLNEGHLDRFYLMLAGLSLLNLFIFVFNAMRYKCKKAS
ncbi:protein NRT1/ PTR FAMILY 8.3 isoform X2 [Brachypodium distachyon]|uniref:protein NRT1/ PTR FAMILY 8.3 isoform X2 n=1 Tax=Brachypodium distachyon TaxID=15368 RepID=UPI000D0D2031|nr:protein NRT1/ PTR FAMILY 8.3 isoform X2 [Brachypodium distachyon]|eukprot:XP_024312584.1 protein NRT1/ PTR FAMILY 8.3 isoform X2 [Brachypodium distachyon]